MLGAAPGNLQSASERLTLASSDIGPPFRGATRLYNGAGLSELPRMSSGVLAEKSAEVYSLRFDQKKELTSQL